MLVNRTQRTLLFCALATVLGKPALANNEDVIARCATIAAVGNRVLCLENALRQASSIAETIPLGAETPSPVPAEPETPAAAASVETESVATASVAATAPRVTERVKPEIVTKVQQEANIGVTDDGSQELGVEQVTPKEKMGGKADRVLAKISSFDIVGAGSLRFQLDNGQIWRQIGDDDQNIRRRIRNAENIPVEMWKTRTGGYRMRILTIGRTVRVKRLK